MKATSTTSQGFLLLLLVLLLLLLLLLLWGGGGFFNCPGNSKLLGLPTGHNRVNSHMHHKLMLAASPTCPCSQKDQTTEHVLQRCLLHKVSREEVWPVSTPLTTNLYFCKQELEKTTPFIPPSGPDRVAVNVKKKKCCLRLFRAS